MIDQNEASRSATPSRSTTFWMSTGDNVRLLGRRWSVAPGGRRASALLIHGLGEHSGRYDEVAGVMNAVGIEVVSYDQRGFGQSEGPKGRLPNSSALLEDAAMVFALVGKDTAAGSPPLLVGHSMGGAIAALAVATGAIVPRGLVLSSPAFKTRVNVAEEAALRLTLRVFPDLPLDSHIRPGQLTRDESVQASIKADRLMHTTVSPRLVISIIDQGAAALAAASNVRVPTLVLLAGDDRIVHSEASRQFAAAMPEGRITLHEFPGLFHEVFHERLVDRTVVLTILRDWLDAMVNGRA